MSSKLFKASDLAKGDYVVVVCDKCDDDPCWFGIPGQNERGVWVARVDSITRVPGKRDSWSLMGYFFYHESRDLTQVLHVRPNAEGIDFEENLIVAVYENDPILELTADDVAEIAANMG